MPIFQLSNDHLPIFPKFLNNIKSDVIRRKTTMFLILQDMFRIHHPSSVAKSELKSLEHIEVYTFDKRTINRYEEKHERRVRNLMRYQSAEPVYLKWASPMKCAKPL